MAETSKQTRVVPQALKVRFITTVTPIKEKLPILKEKLPISPLRTVIPSVKEKWPVLPMTKTGKNLVFPKKNPSPQRPSSMRDKAVHPNKKEPIVQWTKSVKTTISRRTKNNARSENFSSKPPDQSSPFRPLTSLNSKRSQVIHPVDEKSSATIKSLHSPSRPDFNESPSSSSFTKSFHPSLSSSLPSKIAHSNPEASSSQQLPIKSARLSPAVPPSSKVTYLYNPRPDYPAIAKRRGQEGRVLLKIKVSPSGQAASVQVAQSSGYPMLDEAALKTVKQWRFTPATQAGQAIEAWIHVPIVFQIK